MGGYRKCLFSSTTPKNCPLAPSAKSYYRFPFSGNHATYKFQCKHQSLETAVKALFNLYENETSVESTVSKGTNTLKEMLGNSTVESFSFRTCVKPILSENEFGETEIVYESLTAQDCFQNIYFLNIGGISKLSPTKLGF